MFRDARIPYSCRADPKSPLLTPWRRSVRSGTGGARHVRRGRLFGCKRPRGDSAAAAQEALAAKLFGRRVRQIAR